MPFDHAETFTIVDHEGAFYQFAERAAYEHARDELRSARAAGVGPGGQLLRVRSELMGKLCFEEPLYNMQIVKY